MDDCSGNRFASVILAETVKCDKGRLKLQSRGPLDLHNPVGSNGKITSAILIRPRIQCKRDLAHSSLKKTMRRMSVVKGGGDVLQGRGATLENTGSKLGE